MSKVPLYLISENSCMSAGDLDSKSLYRGTSPIRKRTPTGPCRGPIPRVLGGYRGVGEVPLNSEPETLNPKPLTKPQTLEY